jgi:hypothetical protein
LLAWLTCDIINPSTLWVTHYRDPNDSSPNGLYSPMPLPTRAHRLLCRTHRCASLSPVRLTPEPPGEERPSHTASGISGRCCGRHFGTLRPFEVYAECSLARFTGVSNRSKSHRNTRTRGTDHADQDRCSSVAHLARFTELLDAAPIQATHREFLPSEEHLPSD